MLSDAMLRPRWRDFRGLGEIRFADVMIVITLLGLTSVLSVIFTDEMGETRLTMAYLAPVLISAVYLGVWPGFGAALGAVCLLNFFFAVPHYSFTVADLQDLLTLFMFFLVAATTGVLAGNLREQRDAARANAHALQVLSTASGLLHDAESQERVLSITREALAELTDRAVIVLSRQGPFELALVSQTAKAPPPQHADFYAAEQALSRGLTEPAAAAGWNGAAYTLLPIRLVEEEEGAQEIVLGVLRRASNQRDAPYQETAVEVLRQHCALALQRLHFGGRVAVEREKAAMESLRAGLLSSLSHDLRSPLAGILGSVTTINELGPNLPAEARQDLLLGIEAETRRLAAYVSNLLHLTRLQAGSPPDFQPLPVLEVVHGAEARLRQSWPHAKIHHHLAEVPMIFADNALLEQAIYNLLDNAMRHGGGNISLSSGQRGDRIYLTIADQGAGMGAKSLASDGFDAKNSGSGLGLTISHAIATALGGDLRTEVSTTGRSVTLTFPIATAVSSSDQTLQAPL